MKKLVLILAVVAAGVSVASCKKCSECHYDGPNGEVELGEKCDEELEDLEGSGMTVDGTTYEVHCHAH